MCTEACRAALALTLKSDKSSAEDRKHESDGDGQPADLARTKKIKKFKNILFLSNQSSSIILTSPIVAISVTMAA